MLTRSQICTELLYLPLTLLDCLHTFCGYCLKEWFSWQGSHPSGGDLPQFTCPSCRASVRDTKHDAKVTTLLDLFLRSHPEKQRSVDEQREIAEKYKPGDKVLPVILPPTEDEREDRRLLEQVREMSLREVQGRGGHNETGTASRTRRSASMQQAAEQQRIEDARRRRRATRQMNSTTRSRSPLDPNARHVEHQSSLRSLLSNPDFSETAIQEEILRQIAEEGLLDGIDLRSLDPDQEEELTERIAEAFRRRQRRRARSNEHEHERPTNVQPTYIHQRSRSQSANTPNTEHSRQPGPDRRHFLEPTQYPAARAHRRSTSDRGADRRRTSPVSGQSSEQVHPARRSATEVLDLRGAHQDARAQAITVPASTDGVVRSGQEVRTQERQRRESTRTDRREVPNRQRSDPTAVSNHPSSIASPHTPSSRPLDPAIRHRSHSRSSGSNQQDRLTVPLPRPTPSRSEVSPRIPLTFLEPSISCGRCGKKKLEYEVHKQCTRCNNGNYHLCLLCYRRELGCLHWFGFGDSAQIRFENMQQKLPPDQRSREPPHILQSRRYLPPAKECVLFTIDNDERRRTTSDPSQRLQDGLFCDMCQSFADDCFWKCSECNDGEWGFCNQCVNTGKCCTHPLLPIARVDERTGQMRLSSSSSLSTNTSTSPIPGSSVTFDSRQYRVLTFSTKCNICAYPIPPSTTRFHCPTCNGGDYDLCTNCYLKLGVTSKVSRDNGRNGWRRCLQNHRMIIVGFEDHDEGQRRVVVKGLVGGYAMKDDLDPTNQVGTFRPEPTSPTSPLARQDSDPWEWHEATSPNSPDATGTAKGTRRKLNRSRHHLSAGTPESPKSPVAPRFPPSGGIGLRLIAIWPYYPDPEEVDEIMFPRGAEITEAENINDDWLWGCYAGQKGLFPGYYATVIGEVLN